MLIIRKKLFVEYLLILIIISSSLFSYLLISYSPASRAVIPSHVQFLMRLLFIYLFFCIITYCICIVNNFSIVWDERRCMLIVLGICSTTVHNRYFNYLYIKNHQACSLFISLTTTTTIFLFIIYWLKFLFLKFLNILKAIFSNT